MPTLCMGKLRIHEGRLLPTKSHSLPGTKPMPSEPKGLGLVIRQPTSLCLPVKSRKCELYFMFVSHKYILIDNVNKVNFITHLEWLRLHPGSVLPSRRAEQCTIVSKCLSFVTGTFAIWTILPPCQTLANIISWSR